MPWIRIQMEAEAVLDPDLIPHFLMHAEIILSTVCYSQVTRTKFFASERIFLCKNAEYLP